MRLKVQLVIRADDDGTDTIHDVAVLEKDCQRIEQLGLSLAEAKQLLTQLQQHVVAYQAAAFVMTRSHCQACGTPLQRKEETTRLLRRHCQLNGSQPDMTTIYCGHDFF
jgi:hypothetical protein